MLLSILDTQPIDIWHDTAFQFVVIAFVTLFAGTIGAFVTYWIYRKQRSYKELSYQLTSFTPIALVRTGFKERIEIKFDGKPIRNLNLLIIKIWNSGNVTIKYEDYFETIKFEFEGALDSGGVVGSEVLRTEPQYLIDTDDIKTFIKYEQDYIELTKFPLNPNETIKLKVLYIGYPDHVHIRGRIADGNVFETYPNNQLLKRSRKTRINTAALLTWYMMLFIGVIVVTPAVTPISSVAEKIALSPLALILATLLALFFIIEQFTIFYILLSLTTSKSGKRTKFRRGFI